MTVPLLPEPPRLDRHDTYVGVLIYVWLASVGIYFAPIATGPIGAMDPTQQKLLAICMFIGSGLALFGSAMGEPLEIRITKPIRWVLQSRAAKIIRRHPYEPLPVRHCYRLGVAGLCACVVSMGVIPVTPGSQIVLSEHTFWRGQFDKGV